MPPARKLSRLAEPLSRYALIADEISDDIEVLPARKRYGNSLPDRRRVAELLSRVPICSGVPPSTPHGGINNKVLQDQRNVEGAHSGMPPTDLRHHDLLTS